MSLGEHLVEVITEIIKSMCMHFGQQTEQKIDSSLKRFCKEAEKSPN